MTAYEVVDAALSVLVGNRAFADVVPRGTRLPHIRFTTIGGRINTTLCDDGDVSELVQIDVSTSTALERRQLQAQVQAALKLAPRPCLQTSAPVYFWDDELDAYRVSLTYTMN